MTGTPFHTLIWIAILNIIKVVAAIDRNLVTIVLMSPYLLVICINTWTVSTCSPDIALLIVAIINVAEYSNVHKTNMMKTVLAMIVAASVATADYCQQEGLFLLRIEFPLYYYLARFTMWSHNFSQAWWFLQHIQQDMQQWNVPQ